MLTFEQLLSFLPVAILITASPGPDNLMVLGMGISKGRKQGIAFGLGCALGCLSHTFLAVVGGSALIAASPPAFTLLKVGGGLYLIFLGFNALRNTGDTKVEALEAANQTLSKLFFQRRLRKCNQPQSGSVLSFIPATVRHTG